MAYVDQRRKRDVERYRKVARNINICGVHRLREYCTKKKYHVRNFDKDFEIVKHCIKYGPTACVAPFGVSKQFADQLVDRYGKYAVECVANGVATSKGREKPDKLLHANFREPDVNVHIEYENDQADCV